MASVRLNNLGKVYDTGRNGKVTAVDSVNLEISDGEFMVLVGPSGCGKSTLLRLIAGLENPTSGSVHLDDCDVSRVKPQDRDVAMVFQNYALFPHLNVEQNMAFSLKFRKIPKPEIQSRVAEAAEVLGLAEMLRRRPAELSGGQRQRVALGRAMVCQPKVFLLDEPLSNLDARMRVEMRTEIAQLHRRLETTMIFVTHDQTEAMTLGQRLCVLNQGQVMQLGAPMDLYQRPAHRFVGDFIGTPGMNFVRGKLDFDRPMQFMEQADGGVALGLPERLVKRLAKFAGMEVVLGIRPENVRLAKNGVGFAATLETIETLGHEALLYARTAGHSLIVRTAGLGQAPSDGINLEIDWDAVTWFDGGTGQALN